MPRSAAITWDSDRLGELLGALEELAAGQLDRRCPISPARDELDAVGYAINILVEELEVANASAERQREQLARSEARLGQLLASSPTVIYTCTPAPPCRATFVSDNAAQELGFAPREFLDDPDLWQSRLHPMDAPRVLAERGELLARGSLSQEYRWRAADGSWRWILDKLAVVRDERGEPVEGIGSWTEITDRKLAEESVRESEGYLRDLFDNSNDLIQSVAADGSLQFVNRAWCETLGYADGELPDLNIFELIDPESLPHCLDVFARLTEGENVGTIDMVLLTKDGRRVELEGNVNARFAGGKLVSTRGIFRNVTEQRRAMAVLREREEDLAAVLEASPEAIGTVNLRTGLFENLNRGSERLFGLSCAELEKLGPNDVSPELQPDGHASAVAAAEWIARADAGERVTFSWVHRNAHGDLIPCEVRLAAVAPPREHLVRFSINDISQRAKAEQELQKLTWAVEQSPAVVVITNTAGEIEYVNSQFTELTGYSFEEVVGRNPRVLKSGVHPRAFYDELWATIGAGRVWSGELCNRKKGGERYWESAAIGPIKDAHGRVTHFVAVKEDITERKQKDEELRLAMEAAHAANQSKSLFLANMSHEIRTPMNAVIGFSQLLLRDPAITPSQRGNVLAITRAGDHLLSLIDDILQLAKIEAGRMTLSLATIDVRELLRDLSGSYAARASEKGLGFAVEGTDAIPRYLETDETKLRQVLTNLLQNALKFTERGAITLRAASRETRAGPRLTLEVADTGSGVAEAEMERLFQKFEQTESGRRSGQGTGLGLAISREMARLMGGDITAESQLGRGSVFRVDLPAKEVVVKGPVSKKEPGSVARVAPGQPTPRVLVADDQENNRRFLSGLLAKVGFEVRHAVNGEEAVTAVEEWQPHLVLMDMRMPRMDGIEATRQIRASGASTKVLIVSASAFEDDRQLARDAGADGFISKPFRDRELFAEIRQQLQLEYVYDAPEGGAVSLPPRTRRAGVVLPPDLRGQIRQAALSADIEVLLELLPDVEAHDRGLAKAIRGRCERYDYSEILSLIEAEGA